MDNKQCSYCQSILCECDVMDYNDYEDQTDSSTW